MGQKPTDSQLLSNYNAGYEKRPDSQNWFKQHPRNRAHPGSKASVICDRPITRAASEAV